MIKTFENVQIPIYKLEKKKIIVSQPKKDAAKSEQMDVSIYISRLS